MSFKANIRWKEIVNLENSAKTSLTGDANYFPELWISLNCPQGNTIHRECDWMEIIRIFIPLWQVSALTESVYIVPSTLEELFAHRCTTNVFVLCTKMPHIMHTCDNFCIKSIFIYNKGSILRNAILSSLTWWLLMQYYVSSAVKKKKKKLLP